MSSGLWVFDHTEMDFLAPKSFLILCGTRKVLGQGALNVRKPIDNLYGQGSMNIRKTKMLIYNTIMLLR